MRPRNVVLSRADAERLFALADSAARDAGAELAEVGALRRVADMIGESPAEHTHGYEAHFPHVFEPVPVSLTAFRQTVLVAMVFGKAIRRPETDDEVLTRLGGWPAPVCGVGTRPVCGQPGDDGIHLQPWKAR
jgi:hypothetical protein